MGLKVGTPATEIGKEETIILGRQEGVIYSKEGKPKSYVSNGKQIKVGSKSDTPTAQAKAGVSVPPQPEVKKIQVAGSLLTPSGFYYSFNSVSDKFTELIKSKGVTIDNNHDDNVLSIGVYVKKTEVNNVSVFTVTMKARYRQPCWVRRLDMPIDCYIWEVSKPLKFFRDTQKLTELIDTTLERWALDFSNRFTEH